MSRTQRALYYWVPVLVWMGLIFYGSGHAFSVPNTSRLLAPLIHWLFPAMSDETVRAGVAALRKLGHLTEYSVLAALIWRARVQPGRQTLLRAWSWPAARFAFLGAVLYAASDELHQSFVPTRQGSIRDFLLDACGAAAGLLIIYALRSRPGRKNCQRLTEE